MRAMDGRPDELSYDPRSWLGPVPGPAAKSPSPPPPPPRQSSRSARPLWLASAAVAVAGFATAYLARTPTQWAAPASAPATRAAPALASAEQRILNLASAADVGSSLSVLGIVPADANEAGRMAVARLGRDPGEIRLAVTADASGRQLRHAEITRADGSGIEIARKGQGALQATSLSAKLTRQMMFVRGELDGESFYSSAVAAGVADVLVDEFANAFRYDFDMQREVQPGDVFEAGFEQRMTPDGERVGQPELVYAALTTNAKSRALYRFAGTGDGVAEWFDSAGKSSRRALMRTPVEAARISSGFGMRNHPILGFAKLHRGTDFAAPTGTPIFAAGDATVVFAGPKGPNGNFVKLRHDNGWETLYLHMNRIMPGVGVGGHVAQGQQIGEVGTTGRSTGPHLHYEVHIAGAPVDPLSIDTGQTRTLTGAMLARFRKIRDAIDARRAAEGV